MPSCTLILTQSLSTMIKKLSRLFKTLFHAPRWRSFSLRKEKWFIPIVIIHRTIYRRLPLLLRLKAKQIPSKEKLQILWWTNTIWQRWMLFTGLMTWAQLMEAQSFTILTICKCQRSNFSLIWFILTKMRILNFHQSQS